MMYNFFMTSSARTLAPDSFTNFGELLRYLRERAEISQCELALQVGYHNFYMRRIEKNERLPQLAASEEKTLAPCKSGLRSASHAPKTDSALPKFESPLNSLPLSLTPILGREKQVKTVIKLLSRLDVGLVTLVDPRGVLKSIFDLRTLRASRSLWMNRS